MSTPQEVQAKLRNRALQQMQNFRQSLYMAGLVLQSDSQELVPVQTGDLKNSAQTRLEQTDAGVVEVIVSYNTDYAGFVHENLEAAHGAAFNTKYATQIAEYGGNHPYYFNRREQEQAKFLESAARRNATKYRDIIRNGTKR